MTKKIILAILLLFTQLCYAQVRTNTDSSKAGALYSEDSSKITELFFAGLKEKIAGNFQKSDVFYKQILALDPANHATMFELAKSYHIQNLDKEAERLIRDAINLKPANEWYWDLLADIYETTNNLSGLLQVCDELIKIAPKKEAYYFDKGSVLFEMNRLDEALAVYDLIEKKQGQSRSLDNARQRIYQKQRMTGMTALGLEERIKTNPDNLGNYIELSQLYYSSGQKDKALQVLQAAKRTDQNDATVRMSLANLYRLEGKPDQAFAELKSALENAQIDVESKINIVLAQSVQKKETGALQYVTDLAAILVKQYPGNIRVRSVYGDILLHDKRPRDARESYINALKLNDKEYSVWESLIRMDISQSDFAAAVKDSEQALHVFPGNTALYYYAGQAYFHKSDYDKAISYLKNAEGHEVENKQLLSQICSALGNSYQAVKRFKESDQAYEKALLFNPDNTEALNQYAYSLSLREAYYLAKAEQMAQRATELDPDDVAFKKTYDRIVFLSGKYKNAVAWVESAMGGLELTSQDYLVWENIIRIQYEISDFNGLIENAGKTITIFPDQATPYLYLGLTYTQKKNYEKAKEYLQNAANLQKENTGVQTLVYSGLGDMYKALNNSIESDKAYEKALQIDPYNLYALNIYAYNLSARGINLIKAEQMAQHANELQPDNPFFEDTYAQVLFRQKKYNESRIWIEKAIADDKGVNPVLFEHYGDVLVFLNETESAIEQWTKAKNGGVKSEKLEKKINGKKYVE